MGEPMKKQRNRWRTGVWGGIAAIALFKIGFTWAELLTGGDIVMNSISLNSGGGGTQTGGEVSLTASLGGSSNVAMSGGVIDLSAGSLSGNPLSRPDLTRSRAFPTLFKPSLGHDRLTFRGLTKNAAIRIYTLSGQHIITLNKTDGNSEDYVWHPVLSEAGRPLSSGVYFYQIDGDSGSRFKGKFMIIK